MDCDKQYVVFDPYGEPTPVKAIRYADDKSNAREVFIVANGSAAGWDRCERLGGLGWMPGCWVVRDSEGNVDVHDREPVSIIGKRQADRLPSGVVMHIPHPRGVTVSQTLYSNGWTGPWLAVGQRENHG